MVYDDEKSIYDQPLQSFLSVVSSVHSVKKKRDLGKLFTNRPQAVGGRRNEERSQYLLG